MRRWQRPWRLVEFREERRRVKPAATLLVVVVVVVAQVEWLLPPGCVYGHFSSTVQRLVKGA